MAKMNLTLAGRVTGKLLLWMLGIVICGTVITYFLSLKTITRMQAENYHSKMLINYEYTRRVLSDVYVSVTNNVDFLESTLDKPEGQMDVMKRIVEHGTRVRSCGMNFISYYYPEKGQRYCPFAWRDHENPDVIMTEEKGDEDYDYLNAAWFKGVLENDTTEWSEPFFDGYDHVTALAAYMVPIHNADGTPVAVLGADISLDWLTKKLEETDSAYNAQTPFTTKILNLRSKSFIINHNGEFVTHPEGKQLEGVFYAHLKPVGHFDMAQLMERMKQGAISDKESDQRFTFDGEECYLFYTPVKYTKWMMVSVVPCQLIDTLGMSYAMRHIGLMIVAMLLIAGLCYYYIRREEIMEEE
jgi:hypothetical protein